MVKKKSTTNLTELLLECVSQPIQCCPHRMNGQSTLRVIPLWKPSK